MVTVTYKQLTDVQQHILCELAADPRSYGGRYSRSIDKMTNEGLIRSNPSVEARAFHGWHRIKWHCSITPLGLDVLFPDDSAAIARKQ